MIDLEQPSKTRLRSSRRELLSTSYHRKRMWDPGSVHMRRFIKLLVRAVPPCVTRRGRLASDPTQGFEVEGFWKLTAIPPLEAQRVMKEFPWDLLRTTHTGPEKP